MIHVPLTTRIVTGGEQDPTGGLSLANDVTGRRRTKYSVLTNKYLLHSIGSANFSNQLNELRVIEASVPSDDQEAALCTLRNG